MKDKTLVLICQGETRTRNAVWPKFVPLHTLFQFLSSISSKSQLILMQGNCENPIWDDSMQKSLSCSGKSLLIRQTPSTTALFLVRYSSLTSTHTSLEITSWVKEITSVNWHFKSTRFKCDPLQGQARGLLACPCPLKWYIVWNVSVLNRIPLWPWIWHAEWRQFGQVHATTSELRGLKTQHSWTSPEIMFFYQNIDYHL